MERETMESSEQKIVVFTDETFHNIDIVRMIAFSETQEDPFYVCDIPDIVWKYQQWVQKLPRIKPFFAMKSNNTPIVLKTLAALGVGFDCATAGEIKTLLQLKIHPEKIIFANTIKPKSAIRLAKEIGIWCMTFDNELELQKVKEIHPSAKLIIRIKVNSTKARVALDKKFGCEFDEEAPRLLRLASYLQLAVCGVSFHVGSDSDDPEAFHHSIKHARELFDLGNSLGHDMNVLDIGGGFPGNRGSTIDPFVTVINASLEEYFPKPDVLIIAEPGRYFVSSAMTLATQIQYVREGNELKPTEYFINDGCYGSFNKTKNFSVEPTPMFKVPDKQPMTLEKCILWGPTCDSGDCLQAQYLLPKMKVEDWIKFKNLGAYTLTICTEFSLIPVPRAFAVADCSTRNLLQNLQPNMRTDFIFANDEKFDITLWNQHKSSNHETCNL